MATLLNVETSLAEKTPTAPPSWVNAELCTINSSVILHSGGGELAGGWHSQDSDEILLVLSGACEVDTADGPIRVTPGSLIHIGDGEPHRVRTEPGTRLVAFESPTAKRTPLDGPAAP
jgi:mannose-6-phosphate isomerase-like protein (cupin superfamily)